MRADIDVLIAKLEAIGKPTPGQLAALKRLPINRVSLERGQDAVHDGQLMRHSCIVLEGMLFRHKTMIDGNRQILSFHPPGDIPDLQSLHLKRVDYSLTASCPTIIGTIEHQAVHAALREEPGLTDLLWRDTLIDSARFLTWIMLVGQASAEARMAHLFCEMYVRLDSVGDTQDRSFRFPITQGDLADALGMSIVHANRTLQNLRAESMLSFNNGRAEILDWDRLAHLAQFDPAYLHLQKN
jgi:CRP-like cAMP-binding protein